MQIIAVKQVKRVNSAPLYCSKNLALCITLSINKRIYYVGMSQTRDVPLITLCAVCARGLCDKLHLCICMCICCKLSTIWQLPSQKFPEKHSWRFHFTLRCHECDGRLRVHPRSSNIE